MSQPVTLINTFTVPPEESERFLQWWTDNAPLMSDQPGFVRARLYRPLAADAEPHFVNVAEWESTAALDAARVDPKWLAAVQRMLDDPDLHAVPRPAVYRIAVEVHPGAEP